MTSHLLQPQQSSGQHPQGLLWPSLRTAPQAPGTREAPQGKRVPQPSCTLNLTSPRHCFPPAHPPFLVSWWLHEGEGEGYSS